MIEVREQAVGRWRALLPLLGVPTDFLSGKQRPCPICGGKDRARFDDKEGRGTFYCNSCGSGDGFKLVMGVNNWDFRTTAEQVRQHLDVAPVTTSRPEMSQEQATKAMRGLWNSGDYITPTDDAGRYLASRGIFGPFPQDLRFVESAWIDGKQFPALLALVRGPDGKPVNVHRTFLQNGSKARIENPRRLMSGKVPDGSAIRLSEYSTALGVAEGIETAYAASKQFGVPVWSCISAPMLEKFEAPTDIEQFFVFGDNDGKFAGQAAAYRLGARVAQRRNPPDVRVYISPSVGTDWADMLETGGMSA